MNAFHNLETLFRFASPEYLKIRGIPPPKEDVVSSFSEHEYFSALRQFRDSSIKPKTKTKQLKLYLYETGGGRHLTITRIKISAAEAEKEVE